MNVRVVPVHSTLAGRAGIVPMLVTVVAEQPPVNENPALQVAYAAWIWAGVWQAGSDWAGAQVTAIGTAAGTVNVDVQLAVVQLSETV